MTIANCPRCSEQVSVPDSASHDATVRCPFCQDEYTLGEALAQLPPSLIVVSDFDEAPLIEDASPDDSPWAALNLEGDDIDDADLSAVDDSPRAAAFDFGGGTATATKAKTAIRPTSRARKPKGSPVKSVLSIVIGGLLAFPIAQLILWYLPGDWKRDFGAGPIVARYVPQIVPAKFRGSQAGEGANGESAGQDSSSAIPDFKFGGGQFAEAVAANGSENEGSFGGDASATAPKNKRKSSGNALTNALAQDVTTDEPMTTEDAAAAGADVFGSPLEVPGLDLGGLADVESPALPSDLVGDTPSATEQPGSQVPTPNDLAPSAVSPPADVAGPAPGTVRNAPQVSADMVAQRVQAAADGSQAWDDNTATAPSASLKRDLYLSLSKLGEALTFANRQDQAVAAHFDETARLLQQIGQQPDKLAVIRGVANGWIARDREVRQTDGVCLTGVVTSVQPIGKLFETTIDSAGQEIAVVSMSDPSEYFAVDREVLVLGTILQDPGTNLGGYEGSRSVAVLDGMHVNIPSE